MLLGLLREAINIIIIIIVGAVIIIGIGAMAVGVEYHGGFGGIGIRSAMVVGVSNLEAM